MPTQTLPFATLDVFTTTPYLGNPLGVITLPDTNPLSQDQLQLIAREFNLSEVVFVHANPPSGSPSRKIQIFTTHNELPFAGHPIVGTATYLIKHLGETGLQEFETKGGKIGLSIDDSTGFVKAVIPQKFVVYNDKTFKSSLTGRSHPATSLVPGLYFIMVQVDDVEALGKAGDEGNRNLAEKPFSPELYLGKEHDSGIIGTKYFTFVGKEEGGRERYRTRMFAHVEDSGTGSACSALGCFLSLQGDDGQRKFIFEQGVEMGRRNEIFVDVDVRGGQIEKVVLSGGAVVVMKGTLSI
jgi:PhzF family phenazine biosynthesis protein